MWRILVLLHYWRRHNLKCIWNVNLKYAKCTLLWQFCRYIWNSLGFKYIWFSCNSADSPFYHSFETLYLRHSVIPKWLASTDQKVRTFYTIEQKKVLKYFAFISFRWRPIWRNWELFRRQWIWIGRSEKSAESFKSFAYQTSKVSISAKFWKTW